MAILFSPKAIVDLSNIWQYTVEKWGENQADSYINELSSACNKLLDGLSQEISVDYILPGYHKTLVGKHVIYFTRQETGLTIIRILHQRMDVDEVL